MLKTVLPENRFLSMKIVILRYIAPMKIPIAAAPILCVGKLRISAAPKVCVQ